MKAVYLKKTYRSDAYQKKMLYFFIHEGLCI